MPQTYFRDPRLHATLDHEDALDARTMELDALESEIEESIRQSFSYHCEHVDITPQGAWETLVTLLSDIDPEMIASQEQAFRALRTTITQTLPATLARTNAKAIYNLRRRDRTRHKE